MDKQNLKPFLKQSINDHSIMILCLVLSIFFTPRLATAGLFSDLSIYIQDNSLAEYDSNSRDAYYAFGKKNTAIEYLLFNPDSFFVFDQRSHEKLGLSKRHSFTMTPMTLDLDYEDASRGKDSLLRWDDLGVTEADTGKFTSLEFMPADTWFVGAEYQMTEGTMTGHAQDRQPFGFFSFFVNVPVLIDFDAKFWRTWVGRQFSVYSFDIRPKLGLTIIELNARATASLGDIHEQESIGVLVPLPLVGIDVVKDFEWFKVKASLEMSGINYQSYGARAPSMMIEVEKEMFGGSSFFISYRKASYRFWDNDPIRPVHVKFQQDGFITGFAYEF
jgi:hypothetical protein